MRHEQHVVALTIPSICSERVATQEPQYTSDTLIRQTVAAIARANILASVFTTNINAITRCQAEGTRQDAAPAIIQTPMR